MITHLLLVALAGAPCLPAIQEQQVNLSRIDDGFMECNWGNQILTTYYNIDYGNNMINVYALYRCYPEKNESVYFNLSGHVEHLYNNYLGGFYDYYDWTSSGFTFSFTNQFNDINNNYISNFKYSKNGLAIKSNISSQELIDIGYVDYGKSKKNELYVPTFDEFYIYSNITINVTREALFDYLITQEFYTNENVINSQEIVDYFYLKGFQEGYSEGYEEGYHSRDGDYENGYNEGLTEGTNSGFDRGFEEGKHEGYNQGYEKGRIEGFQDGLNEKGFEEIFWGILDTPFKILKDAFNFEIMGINVANILIGIVSIVAVGWLIKRFL